MSEAVLAVPDAPVPGRALSRFAAFGRFMLAAMALSGYMALAVATGGLAVWILGIDVSQPGDEALAAFVASLGLWTILLLSSSAGILEEIIFRVLPLGLTLWMGRKWRWRPRVRVPVLGLVVLASSAGFAYAHGGHRALAFQGLGGLVLALAFLREEARSRWKRAALLVMTAHFVYDIGVFAVGYGLRSLLGATP